MLIERASILTVFAVATVKTVQVNLTWVLGETATMAIETLWAAVSVTAIVPLGAVDTRVQGAIEAAAAANKSAVKHSTISWKQEVKVTINKELSKVSSLHVVSVNNVPPTTGVKGIGCAGTTGAAGHTGHAGHTTGLGQVGHVGHPKIRKNVLAFASVLL